MPPRAELMRQDVVTLAEAMLAELERTGRTCMVVRRDYETRDRRYDDEDVVNLFATVAGFRFVEAVTPPVTMATGFGGCPFLSRQTTWAVD